MPCWQRPLRNNRKVSHVNPDTPQGVFALWRCRTLNEALTNSCPLVARPQPSVIFDSSWHC
jgi:hypothetical protein